MDIVEALDLVSDPNLATLLAEASDAIVMEREISAKLYRALCESLESNESECKFTYTIEEALNCYQMTREAI